MKKILLAFSILLLLNCSNSSPSDSDVKSAARAAILHNLQDLNSAKFHHNEAITDLGNGSYQYQETINANNAFGGAIRKNAVVTIHWNGGDPSEVSSYTVANLELN